MQGLFAQVVVLAIMVYALLLIVGSPFEGPKLANRYARWLKNSLTRLAVWLIKLPFVALSRLVFGKKKKKKRRRP